MAFARVEDVQRRLGRELTASEREQAELLLDGASGVIEQAVDQTEETINPVPRILRFVAVEVVVRGMANPSGLASEQKAIGAVSTSVRYRDTGGGLWLTDTERTLVREAVLGQLSGTAAQESILDEDITGRLAPASYPGHRDTLGP